MLLTIVTRRELKPPNFYRASSSCLHDILSHNVQYTVTNVIKSDLTPPLTPLAPEQLCVNVTSSLIHILKITQASWRQDLQSGQSANTKKQILQKLPTHRRTGSGKLVPDEGSGESPRAVTNVEKGLALLHSVRFVSQTRQRSRFVPFLLRNSTGLPLRFATLTSVPSKVRSEVLYQGLLS